MKTYRVLSIDAWRECEGYTWNAWYDAGDITADAIHWNARKLNTGKKALVGNKSYRVYASCFSNVACLYIIIKGVKIYVDSWEQ